MTNRLSRSITLPRSSSIPSEPAPRRQSVSGHARCVRLPGVGLTCLQWLRAAVCAVAVLHWSTGAHAAPEVVVSIKPVHSLVAAVMGEFGTPRLILDGASTPHAYQMRPSEAAALHAADLIVWVGEALENFLARPIATLGPDAQVVTLQHADGIRLLRHRQGGLWKAGPKRVDDVDSVRGRNFVRLDAHIWLDPGNARRIVDAVAAALVRVHPAQAAGYRRNAASTRSRIGALEASLRKGLAPVRSHAFIVFHDGYQYFEHAFGLNGIGTVTLGPDRLPGVKRLASLRRALAERDVRCVFTEPQFEPGLARTVIEGTSVRMAELDPLGADIAAGADAWFTVLRRMGDSVVECLGRT